MEVIVRWCSFKNGAKFKFSWENKVVAVLLFQALGLSPVIEKINICMKQEATKYVFKKPERQATITFHITLMEQTQKF